jgi:hypothetical protein
VGQTGTYLHNPLHDNRLIKVKGAAGMVIPIFSRLPFRWISGRAFVPDERNKAYLLAFPAVLIF